jgi:hypothetical protein
MGFAAQMDIATEGLKAIVKVAKAIHKKYQDFKDMPDKLREFHECVAHFSLMLEFRCTVHTVVLIASNAHVKPYTM